MPDTPVLDAFLPEYRAMREGDLDAARSDLLGVLATEDATPEHLARADALAQVVTERNEAAASAQSRRDALSGMTVARRSPATVESASARGILTPNAIVTSDGRVVDAEHEFRTIAARLMDTPDFRNFADRGFRGSAGIEAPGFLERAVITTADFPTNVQRVPSIQSVPDLGYGVLDLVSTSQMSSGSISYIQDTSPTDDLNLVLGNPVPEGTAKPEAVLTFDEATATARTLAGWVAITRQALEDEPQLQGYINNRLSRALRHVLAGEVLNGTGTAPHLQGILPLAPAIAAGADSFASVSAGIAAVEGAGYNPTGIAVNPADWAAFMTDATSGTYGNQVNPFAQVTMTLWGIPVVREPLLAAGTVLVGDFQAGDTLFYRNDVRILVADQHADLFIKNTLVILAEARAANAVFAPKAFAKVTLPVALP